jgi:hypothetical protein
MASQNSFMKLYVFAKVRHWYVNYSTIGLKRVNVSQPAARKKASLIVFPVFGTIATFLPMESLTRVRSLFVIIMDWSRIARWTIKIIFAAEKQSSLLRSKSKRFFLKRISKFNMVQFQFP